jgi:hypothetical protein
LAAVIWSGVERHAVIELETAVGVLESMTDEVDPERVSQLPAIPDVILGAFELTTNHV